MHAQYDAHGQHRLPQPGAGPSARVAVELTEEAALALADAIHQAIAAAPPGLASRPYARRLIFGLSMQFRSGIRA